MMDNVTNNHIIVDKLIDLGSTFDSNQCLPCAGHVIRLVVKAILYGNDIQEFNRDVSRASNMEQFRLWKKFGAIGKVHNTVKYIMRSAQRRQQFLSGQSAGILYDHTAKLLIKDGGVR